MDYPKKAIRNGDIRVCFDDECNVNTKLNDEQLNEKILYGSGKVSWWKLILVWLTIFAIYCLLLFIFYYFRA